MEQGLSVVSDIKNLSELLDGACVGHMRLAPNGGRLRLEMELTRACREMQPVARRGVFGRPKTPWMKCRLTLNQAKEASVVHLAFMPLQGPPQEPLLACEAVAGGYQLVVTTPERLRLTVTLEQLDGQFADVGGPVESP